MQGIAESTAPPAEMLATGCLRRLVDRQNRRLYLDAGLEVLLGLVFCAVTFGALFVGFKWGLWFLAGLRPQFAMGLTMLLLAVAFWSAQRRVDPLRRSRQMTHREKVLAKLNQQLTYMRIAWTARTGMLPGYFSPKNALAAANFVLIAGPANLFQAIRTLGFKLHDDLTFLQDALTILGNCQDGMVADELGDYELECAHLLRRLGLVTLRNEETVLITPKGVELLAASTL